MKFKLAQIQRMLIISINLGKKEFMYVQAKSVFNHCSIQVENEKMHAKFELNLRFVNLQISCSINAAYHRTCGNLETPHFEMPHS